MGPEMALSRELEIDADDLRLDMSRCLIEQTGVGRVFTLCFDCMFAHIGKCLSAASKAKIR